MNREGALQRQELLDKAYEYEPDYFFFIDGDEIDAYKEKKRKRSFLKRKVQYRGLAVYNALLGTPGATFALLKVMKYPVKVTENVSTKNEIVHEHAF